jgi:hypothetical protein
MVNTGKKAFLSSLPFFVLITSIFLIQVIRDSFSLLDTEWRTRQFILAFFIFAGLTIIPNLLHLRVYFSRFSPTFLFNLSHHPIDIRSSHEFQIRNFWICSGCFGNFLGILIGETSFLIYFINRRIIQGFSPIYLLGIGILCIFISYSRYFIELRPKFRLVQHISLFSGLSLTLIASDLLFESALSMIILLPTWLLFLVIRVYLSKLDHQISSQ